MQLNMSSFGPNLGRNPMIFGWNPDSTMNTRNLNIETFEQSKLTKKCTINGKKYISFHFRFPAEVRRYIGTDHVRGVATLKNLNDYLNEVLGQQYRCCPTMLYGICDDIFKGLDFTYFAFKNEAG